MLFVTTTLGDGVGVMVGVGVGVLFGVGVGVAVGVAVGVPVGVTLLTAATLNPDLKIIPIDNK